MAKQILADMARGDKRAPNDIVRDKGMSQISDSTELEQTLQTVLKSCPVEVERYRNGETKLVGYFVGQAMKATKGQANPKLTRLLLLKLLD